MATVNYLTDEQRKAVSSQDRVFMLLAPAGSGKTRVLINRIIHILKNTQGESFRILAVTYTVKAAEELHERITKEVGDQSWRVEANTIHSFVLYWLRHFGSPVGVSRNVVVYTEDIDRFGILQRYLDTLGEPTLNGREMKQIFDKFDTMRIKNLLPDTLSDSSGFGTNTSLREMYDAYLTSLLEAGGIDYPGILYQFLQLLDLEPSLVERIQRVYKHILVDECQDLTKVQSEILKVIVGNKLHLFVVGDERQSINSWAGGGIENAHYLVGTDVKTQNLLHNFRCAKQILSLANRVANHFSDSKNGTITAENAPPGDYIYRQADSEDEEACLVADWVYKLLNGGFYDKKNILIRGETTEVETKEIGIIGRTKYALDIIYSKLQQMNIPLSILIDTNGVLLTSEARLLLALIEIRNNPKNRPAVRRASQELQDLGNFENVSLNNPQDVWQTATKILPDIVSVAKTPLEKFEFNLRNISIETKDWNDDFEWLLKWWNRYRSATRPPDRTFQGLINFIFRSQRTLPTDQGVRLLTAHRAKGLEFRAVAVVGLNQGSFPHYRSLDLPELDEERRAFYVSITRASRSLLLARPKTRTYRSGETRVQEPSQFLKEAGIL